MAPWHPVPEGYGSPCDNGEIVTQGTGSGPVLYAYENVGDVLDDHDDLGDLNRSGRDLSSDGKLFDC